MSKNHGRRILIDGKEARNLKRSELYDTIWAMEKNSSSPEIDLLTRKEAKRRAAGKPVECTVSNIEVTDCRSGISVAPAGGRARG